MDFSELLGGGNDVVLDSEDDELLEPGTTLVGFPSVPPSAFSHKHSIFPDAGEASTTADNAAGTAERAITPPVIIPEDTYEIPSIADRAKMRSRAPKATQPPVAIPPPTSPGLERSSRKAPSQVLNIIELTDSEDELAFRPKPKPKKPKAPPKSKDPPPITSVADSSAIVEGATASEVASSASRPRPRPRPVKKKKQDEPKPSSPILDVTPTSQGTLPQSGSPLRGTGTEFPPSDPPPSFTSLGSGFPPIAVLPQIDAWLPSSSPRSAFDTSKDLSSFMGEVDQLHETNDLSVAVPSSSVRPAGDVVPTDSGYSETFVEPLIGRAKKEKKTAKPRKKKKGEEPEVAENTGDGGVMLETPKAPAKTKRRATRKVEVLIVSPGRASRGRKPRAAPMLAPEVPNLMSEGELGTLSRRQSPRKRPLDRRLSISSLSSAPDSVHEEELILSRNKNKRKAAAHKDIDESASPKKKSKPASNVKGKGKGKAKQILSENEDEDELNFKDTSMVSEPALTVSTPVGKKTTAFTDSRASPTDPADSGGAAKENVEPLLPIHTPQRPQSTPRSEKSISLRSSQYSVPKTTSSMSELIRRVTSQPGSPFPGPSPRRPHSLGLSYSPYLKSSKSLLSGIAPLHPNRKTPPLPPPPPPPRKKTKKELEREEKWEEEMVENAGGLEVWACMTDAERADMRKAKWAKEMGGWDD